MRVWLINSPGHWRSSLLFYSPHINCTIAATLLLFHPPDCDNKAHAGAHAHTQAHTHAHESSGLWTSRVCAGEVWTEQTPRRDTMCSHLPPVADFLFTDAAFSSQLSTQEIKNDCFNQLDLKDKSHWNLTINISYYQEFKAWYILFLSAIEFHCCRKLLKTHQWAKLLNWVTCFFITMNMSPWGCFSPSHTQSCCCKYTVVHQIYSWK